MLRRIYIYFLVLSYLILFNSCKRQNMCDCLKSYGEIVSDTRTITTFTTLMFLIK